MTTQKMLNRPRNGPQGTDDLKSRVATLNAPGTPARILTSAEQLFAETGYDGTSIRRIALNADVPIALVNYHFGSKERLYRAIFELRTPTIIDQRVEGLARVQAEPDMEKRLELIIKALIDPVFRLRATEKNASFGRILAREVTDPNGASRGIIADFFDPVAARFIEELKICLPGRPIADIHWGYQTMLGTMIYVAGDTGRIERLSGGACDPDNYDDASAHVTAMLAAALRFGGVPAPTKSK